MAKDKSKNKKTDGKILAEWEEKLSIAILNKNNKEIESIKRLIAFYKKRGH